MDWAAFATGLGTGLLTVCFMAAVLRGMRAVPEWEVLAWVCGTMGAVVFLVGYLLLPST